MARDDPEMVIPLDKDAEPGLLDVPTITQGRMVDKYGQALAQILEEVGEIHQTVVGGAPASDRLRAAAQEVVTARYVDEGDDSAWDRLNAAIGGLSYVLESEKR